MNHCLSHDTIITTIAPKFTHRGPGKQHSTIGYPHALAFQNVQYHHRATSDKHTGDFQHWGFQTGELMSAFSVTVQRGNQTSELLSAIYIPSIVILVFLSFAGAFRFWYHIIGLVLSVITDCYCSPWNTHLSRFSIISLSNSL